MAHTYTEEEIVELYMKKKLTLLVRHGTIAVWEGSQRILKKTKTGKIFRTRQRRDVESPVPKNKSGFISAFNIIANQFTKYGFLSLTSDVKLTGKGRQQNALHLREVDSRRRTMAFERVFKKLFADEIEEYKRNNP
jgi:hypothetical protein